jgi:general secretion pathway protein G
MDASGGAAHPVASFAFQSGATGMKTRGQKKTRATRGFTLVELVVVVAIIGLLASMVIPNMARMANRAREAAVKQNMHLLQTAVEDFAVLSTGRYPDDGSDIADDGHTVQQLCPGAVFPENPYSHTASTVVWDADPNAANPGEMGLNPATPSSYLIKGVGGTGSLLSTRLSTGS